jgi:EAL domain-containing protein (putative c-di-GMP-specific phosphodiesterase class I)
LAHDLGLSIVAEGVENQESQDLLQALNCEYAQGYHICKPAPAEEIDKLLSIAQSDDPKKTKDKNSIELGATQAYKQA